MRPRLEDGLPVVSPASPGRWEKWLAANHGSSPGVWLRLRKKSAGRRSLTYSEALDAALCYGWIDGQKKSGDQASWLQKFTRRGPRSRWSKRNTEHAERLIRAGRMRAPGLAQIESAKKDGRWKAAYDPPSRAAVPEGFLRELRRDKEALAFFKTLGRANLYAIAYRLQTAKKPETRERRTRLILRMLANGETFH